MFTATPTDMDQAPEEKAKYQNQSQVKIIP